MSDRSAQIALAHAPPFVLGSLTVRPSTREVVGAAGTEVLEPRVMQVLVALHRAGGAIVSRDDLTHSCWEGRVVGEDAINRVISRLRRTAASTAAFRIETVTKVGYRLVEPGGARAAEAVEQGVTAPFFSRRIAIGGVAAALTALAGGNLWLTFRPRAAKGPPVPVAALMQQAQVALDQDTREGQNQAIGLYRRVIALAPDYADGWGALGVAYAATAHFRATAESDSLQARAKAAARRALTLDRDNAYGQTVLAAARPQFGNWLANEQAYRRAIADHPDNVGLLFPLGGVLASVGRFGEAAAIFDRLATLSPPTPDIAFLHILSLWAANRMEDADRAMNEAAALFPTHFAIWFARFYVLLYSGRAADAIALGENVEGRPSGIPDNEVDRALQVARAIQSRTPAAVDATVRIEIARAHEGTGYAENAIQFACALGRVDSAFIIADAYYFDRGFRIPEVRFTRQQGSYLPRRDRLTPFLFNPATAPMRRDPRFDRLVGDLGLKRYWERSGSRPDYQRSA